ncbi:hypothetical protein, partial [Xanthomonas translucens]|uniref:hypothetical protein n=1 Tax=Xanthomonas campestris pv. translucens TaxID=343 RepID=UPI001C3FF854
NQAGHLRPPRQRAKRLAIVPGTGCSSVCSAATLQGSAQAIGHRDRLRADHAFVHIRARRAAA